MRLSARAFAVRSLACSGRRDELIDRLARLVLAQRSEGPVSVGFGPRRAFVDPAFERPASSGLNAASGGIGFTAGLLAMTAWYTRLFAASPVR